MHDADEMPPDPLPYMTLVENVQVTWRDGTIDTYPLAIVDRRRLEGKTMRLSWWQRTVLRWLGWTR
jgi:hypothetical protein